MREIRTYGSEGGGAARSPYPYQTGLRETLDSGFRRNDGRDPYHSKVDAASCRFIAGQSARRSAR